MIMEKLIILNLIVSFIALQVKTEENGKCITDNLSLNNTHTITIMNNERQAEKTQQTISIGIPSSTAHVESFTTSAKMYPFSSYNVIETIKTSTASPLSSSPTLSTASPKANVPLHPKDTSAASNQYCSPTLCEFYNGTHTNVRPHIACKNSGNFGPACGLQPHLLKMSERRRNLILDLHNLARSRIASGQVVGYESASRMPQLKWDNELEHLAALHVKRCRFEHDLCHNTPRFPYSGQNIGYFWSTSNITSHTKRMRRFIAKWYQEQKDANQSFIDSFHLHPDNKTIAHFTAMVGDRVHHVGCAVIRFYTSDLTQVLMTCNYDYNNFYNEAVFQTGPTASKCPFKESKEFGGLCDWRVPTYEYENSVI